MIATREKNAIPLTLNYALPRKLTLEHPPPPRPPVKECPPETGRNYVNPHISTADNPNNNIRNLHRPAAAAAAASRKSNPRAKEPLLPPPVRPSYRSRFTKMARIRRAGEERTRPAVGRQIENGNWSFEVPVRVISLTTTRPRFF